MVGRALGAWASGFALAAAWAIPAQGAESIRDLARLSLEELADLVVTTVSKDEESLATAAASVHVLTREEILRSGATTVPEALRLAPNLQVTQLSSHEYTVGARGFAGNVQAQNFSNKLLALVDGRAVYNPLFSGIYWDAVDVVLDDVDRIEIISGPGAMLWGANAVNGVINVITRPATATGGTLVEATGGNRQRTLQARHGGSAGDVAYRVYAKGGDFDALEIDDVSAEDDWRRVQVGFRTDWARGPDAFTVQGDVLDSTLDQPGPSEVNVTGRNVLARWQRAWSERSDLRVQAYYDRVHRGATNEGVAFTLHTYDLEVQHRVSIGARHRVVWGFGSRRNEYRIRNTPGLGFEPSRRALGFSNVFAQDTIALSEALRLSLGVKLEEDPYFDWSVLPEARLAWTLSPSTSLWASTSRAIRAATPFDVDVVERLGGQVFLVGNPEFRSEKVQAFELGARLRPMPDLTLTAAAFYNRYEDLRTIELTPRPDGGAGLPLRWGNRMEGDTYGIEAWAKWQVTDRWRLSPGYRMLKKDLELTSGASRLLGLAQAGLDPTDQALLTSALDLRPGLTFDATLRYQGPVVEAGIKAYRALNARLNWQVRPGIELAVTANHLLNGSRGHREYTTADSVPIEPSVYLEARWRVQP